MAGYEEQHEEHSDESSARSDVILGAAEIGRIVDMHGDCTDSHALCISGERSRSDVIAMLLECSRWMW